MVVFRHFSAGEIYVGSDEKEEDHGKSSSPRYQDRRPGKTRKNLGISRPPKPRPKGRPYAELRASDPDGNFFDISEHGFLEVKLLGETGDSKSWE